MQYDKNIVDKEVMFRDFHYIEHFNRNSRIMMILDFPQTAHYRDLDKEDTINLKKELMNNKNIPDENRKYIFRVLLSKWFKLSEYEEISDDVAKELIKLHYHYDFYHPLGILKNKIYFDYFIQEVGFKFFFQKEDNLNSYESLNAKFRLNDEIVNLLVNKMRECDYNFISSNNMYLLSFSQIREYFEEKYKISDFDNHYKDVCSINRALEYGLNKYFNDQEIRCIKENMIEYCDYIDLDRIVKIMTPEKFSNLYRKLAYKENIINDEFDLYHFRKVVSYFQNNFDLLSFLSDLNDEDLDNLVSAINLNINISFNELRNFNDKFRDSISSYSEKDKICLLLVGKTSEEVQKFLENIVSTPKLAYLLLEFKDMEEYEYLSMVNFIVGNLERIMNEKFHESLSDMFNSFYHNYNLPNYLYNLDIITKNLQDIFVKLYNRDSLDEDKLEKMGKIKEIDGQKYIILDGTYDYSLFLHDLQFRDYDRDDFTESYECDGKIVKNNYICTQYIGRYSILQPRFDFTHYKKFKMDSHGIMTFGDKDLDIKNLNGSQFTAQRVLVTPLDMMFMPRNNSYANSEFDFLRVDNQGKDFEKKYSYHYGFKINDLEYASNIFQMYEYYYANIEKLNWKELYILIGFFSRFGNELEDEPNINEVLREVMVRINELGDLEQTVLYDAIDKYNIHMLSEYVKKGSW